MDTNDIICEFCEEIVYDDNEFCPNCGSIFADYVHCINHEESNADGVCLICSYPFCPDCGKYYNKKFLCNEHDTYEIYESMARVYGGNDPLDVEYIKNALIKEELHPYLFSRKDSPISLGSPDYSLFRASGDSLGYVVNEIKVMVPFQEVLNAEQIISELQERNEYSTPDDPDAE